MSIFRAKMNLDGRRQCARCHKMFMPRAPDQKYGPKCARKIRAQELQDIAGTLNDEEVAWV